MHKIFIPNWHLLPNKCKLDRQYIPLPCLLLCAIKQLAMKNHLTVTDEQSDHISRAFKWKTSDREKRSGTLTLLRMSNHILIIFCTPHTVWTSPSLLIRVDLPGHFVTLTNMGQILITCRTRLLLAASHGYKLEVARGFGLVQGKRDKTRSHALSRPNRDVWSL